MPDGASGGTPDGQTALVLNDGDGTVTVIDLKSKMVRNTFKGGTGTATVKGSTSPSWEMVTRELDK